MKSYTIILIVLLSAIFPVSAKDIEVEPRTGVSTSPYGDWGFNLGGMASFGINSLFYIQSGFLLNTVKPKVNSNFMEVDVPVYASFRIPVKKVKIQLNAGPYVKFNNYMDIGVSAEGGVEYKKIYMNLSYFQNCTQQSEILFNFSIGYKFKLK